ncbi:MAG: hypothetical protein NTW13_03035 [Candidatus Omnitrophica bacterium]|nr:hypothetical protein [Candidatus Omnitrophota bacterium]
MEIATGGPRIREIRKEIGLGPVTQKGIIWNKISTNRVVSITKEVNNIVKALESVRKDRLTEIIKPYMGQATDSEIGHVAEAYSRSLKAAEGDVKLKALISNSFAIALFIHSGERRKGGNAPSYIVHPADMAKDIADNPMGSAKDTVNAICEAWLHDTIEDAQLGFWGQEVLRYNPKADLAAEVRAIIRNKTNYQILKDLDTLTRRYTVTETEKKYFTRIKNGSKLAKRVKFADLKNNFSHFMEVEEDEFPQNFFDNHTQPFIFDFIKDAPVTDEAKIGLLRIMLPQSLHPKLKVSDRQRKSIIDAIAALENELPAPAAQITRLSKMHADSAEISKTINVLKDNGWRRSWLVYRILAQIYAESVLYYLWHLFDNQKGNPVYEVGVCAVIQDYLRKEFGLMPDDVAFIREKFVILGPDNKSGYMYVWTDITVLGVNIGDMRMLGTEITDWDTQAKHVIIKMRIDKDAINKILDAFLERINQPKPNLDRFDQPPSQSEKERFIDDTEVKFGQKLGDWRYEGNDPNAIIEKGTGQRAFRKPAILGQRVGRFKVANGTVKSAVPASAPAVTSAQPAEGKAVVVATQGGPDALASAAALSDSRLREQVERAIGFGRVFVTGMGEIIVQEGKKYRFISEISETDHERTLNQVKARRLQIAVAQSRNDPSEGEVAKALREDNRSAVEGFGSYTVADRDIPGIEKELFERISAAVSRGNLDRLLQDGNNIFERKYRFVGKDGREQAYTQRIMGSVEGGGFRIFHAPAAQVPEILAYLSRLWGKINDKDEMNIEQKKKALAEYEWWFFQCNPSGRAGASLGDAMSMIAQIALGIELRREYIHQDLIALSSTLENYVAGRAKEFQVPETRAAPIDKTGGIDGSTDSPSIPKKSEGPGGIDFRGLPIVTQPMPKPLGGDPSLRSGLPLVAVPNIKLDKEWGEIENMLNGGIIPSIDRIKDYLALSCKSEDCQARIDKALSCIAGILRIEEERCSVTDAALKQLLVLLESDKSANELQLSLAKIEVLAKEPALIGQ